MDTDFFALERTKEDLTYQTLFYRFLNIVKEGNFTRLNQFNQDLVAQDTIIEAKEIDKKDRKPKEYKYRSLLRNEPQVAQFRNKFLIDYYLSGSEDDLIEMLDYFIYFLEDNISGFAQLIYDLLDGLKENISDIDDSERDFISDRINYIQGHYMKMFVIHPRSEKHES